MKKLPFYLFCTLISFHLSAQKTPNKVSQKPSPALSFCAAIAKVRSGIEDDFKKIRSKIQKQYSNSYGEIGYGFNGSVKVPGALNNIVEANSSYPDVYKCFFGTSETMEQAMKKLEVVKKQLTDCLNNFTLTERPNYLGHYAIYYEFLENRTDGPTPHKIALFLLKHLPLSMSNSYSVFIEIDGASPKGTDH